MSTTFGDVQTSAPELSVVMPVRNVAAWVFEAVMSVLTQDLRSIELIVVDDSSVDDTLDVLRGIDDPRLTIVSNPGSGGGTARNHGASLATGAYLAFADGDDVVPSGAYNLLLRQARRTGVEMVVGNYMIFEPNAIFTRHQWLPLYAEERSGLTIADEPLFLRDRVCWNRIFLRRAWNDAGIRFTDAPRSNDIVAMTDAYCAFEFDVIPQIVYGYRKRTGAGSMTARKHAPTSIVGHFNQERMCFQSVLRLQRESVTIWYARAMLENDVWAHIGPLTSLEHLKSPEYDEARNQVQAMVQDLMEVAPQDIPPHMAHTYRAVAANDWTLAALLNDETSVLLDRIADASSEELRRRCRASGINPGHAAAEILRRAAFPYLHDAESFDDEEVLRAARHARMLGTRANVLRQLDDRESQFTHLPVDDGAGAVRAALATTPSRRPLPKRVAGYSRRAGQVVGRVTSASARAARSEVVATIENHPGAVHRIAVRSPQWLRRLVRKVLGRSTVDGEAGRQ